MSESELARAAAYTFASEEETPSSSVPSRPPSILVKDTEEVGRGGDRETCMKEPAKQQPSLDSCSEFNVVVAKAPEGM